MTTGKRFLAAVAAAALTLGTGACAKKERVSPIEADTTRTQAEWLAFEPVRLLRDAVRIDTSEGKPEEPAARLFQHLFDCEGISSEIVCPAPGRCNVLARLPGRRREGALLLLNHLDVAEADPRYWTEGPPFEGVIKGGYLIGRGTYDMKSIGVAQALALVSLKRLGVVPATDILFLGEADEETGQRWGSGWLLANRPEWFAGVAAVLNEGGTTEMILRDVRFWGLETLQAGFASADLRAATGKPLEDLVGRWKKLTSTPVEPHPHVVLGFDLLANHLVNPLTDPLRHLDRVRRNPAELAALPDRYGAFLEARIFWTPVVPEPPDAKDSRRAFVIVSTPPGVDPGSFLDAILQDASRSGIASAWSFSTGPTTASPYPTPFTELLRRTIEAHSPGVPFGPVPTFGGYNTSILFRNRGIPAYGFLPIPMNITDSQRRHREDERVFLRDYLDGVALYADVVADYAVQPPF
ncbi:MAG TPA: M20/M25/M40 family metallo-hydrolase [Thermoanaerobaculia bacterium]|nr:M20/M25/M40 family metallo-hydrolase [Thermoanaerobaculia bacterium]